MSASARSAWDRQRDALRMTVVVHAVQAGCAVLLVLPLLAQLAPQLSPGLYDAPLGRAELLALLETAARDGRRLSFWALGCVAGYALLAPLLALAWMCALARRESIAASLARAASAYLPALALAACALAAWLVAFALVVLLLQPGLAGALPASASLEHAWTLACIAAIAACALGISTVHDLARARLALDARAWPALRFAVRRIDPRLLGQHALLVVAGLAVTAAADLAGRTTLTLPAAALFIGQQLLLFGAAQLRAGWLALALIASDRPARNRSLADGDLDAERLA